MKEDIRHLRLLLSTCRGLCSLERFYCNRDDFDLASEFSLGSMLSCGEGDVNGGLAQRNGDAGVGHVSDDTLESEQENCHFSATSRAEV